ncbi:GSCFA domain-containing protein [uncultured Prevotella sp.]|uniref:GSCFA domain-containing protein n=1 Tax=uncultured Prevotella sp. TaxID=159272 RepID=UPI0026130C46|nr:GSCFA domain-containing protein [uncultured Prevotella sp.]
MFFRTEVLIPKPSFSLRPLQRMLFVGSCFADNIGRRFEEEKFRAVVNPYGVMYNPVSILHTVGRYVDENRNSLAAARPEGESGREVPLVAVFTLGTNHVYRLKETGEIVDNCQKRPQRLFQEEELTIDQCRDALAEAVDKLRGIVPDVQVIITVSPIRYAKYGFHGSQLSKATLLLAADRLCREYGCCSYFPAYEIVNDELRDYRFYKEDMLHPSDQAVAYIWERFSAAYFSKETNAFLEKWRPIKAALNHRPFNPDSEEHQTFMQRTQEKIEELKRQYPELEF